MFSAYKKFEAKDNILRKSDNHLETKSRLAPRPLHNKSTDGLSKLPSTSLNLGTRQEHNPLRNMQYMEGLFKKNYSSGKKTSSESQSPGTGGLKRNPFGHGRAGARATADFGLQQVLAKHQE